MAARTHRRPAPRPKPPAKPSPAGSRASAAKPSPAKPSPGGSRASTAKPSPAAKPPAAGTRASAARPAARPRPAARKPRRTASGTLAAEAQLRAHALAQPEATEHFPWGERAIKVKGKVFLFMRADAGELSLSTKLPASAEVALLLPFAEPTGYGLGKAGWVTARFTGADPLPVDMLCSWIDESYQAIAPAKLAALARADQPAAGAR